MPAAQVGITLAAGTALIRPYDGWARGLAQMWSHWELYASYARSIAAGEHIAGL